MFVELVLFLVHGVGLDLRKVDREGDGGFGRCARAMVLKHLMAFLVEGKSMIKSTIMISLCKNIIFHS